MIDVGRDYGTSGCHFVAHEFRRDVALYAEGFCIVVLTYGNIFHLRCDYALTRKCHLGYITAFGRTPGCISVGETDRVETFVGLAHASVVGCNVGKLFEIFATLQPLLAKPWESGVDVDTDFRVGVHAACVIDIDGIIFAGHLLSVDYLYCRGEG